ncbi:hypothetical protein HanRHA438_Chr07g0320731 [Helianthus annuus]|nr:hypothetical protein HanHA89_Chr07g0273721 [Helianthus annuus]KAJ0823911.1 hypothetical protein HanLR1_Chr00c0135g0718111 [Helianthus annuus]KAJ0909357.1 hypothetical protein HanRHA438_Chr07g0320731 [Helianthus annuus]
MYAKLLEQEHGSSFFKTTVRRHRRIIMFPFPFRFQGHINPMFQLANLLYSKGFSITILHTMRPQDL